MLLPHFCPSNFTLQLIYIFAVVKKRLSFKDFCSKNCKASLFPYKYIGPAQLKAGRPPQARPARDGPREEGPRPGGGGPGRGGRRHRQAARLLQVQHERLRRGGGLRDGRVQGQRWFFARGQPIRMIFFVNYLFRRQSTHQQAKRLLFRSILYLILSAF